MTPDELADIEQANTHAQRKARGTGLVAEQDKHLAGVAQYVWPLLNEVNRLMSEAVQVDTHIEETEAQADQIAAINDIYSQALWDVYAALGCDTDGDATPRALISGMGPEGFARMVVQEAKDYRAEGA